MFTHRNYSTLPLIATVTSAAVVMGILSGCGGALKPPSGTAPASMERADTGPASCVDRVFARLSESQRVGQLFLVGLSADRADASTATAEREYHFGSVLFAANTSDSARAVSATTSYVQSLATGSATGGVRFFVAANQEGGQVRNLRGPGFPAMPSALAQGSWPASVLRKRAAAWGRSLTSAGVNLDLAPVMDVVPAGTGTRNAPIGRLDREFGSTAAGAGAHGAAFIRGLASAGVATAPKHFPGLGRVTGNTDFTANVTDSATGPGDPDLASYRAAAAAGAPFMMVALATYTKIDASRLAAFSPAVMRLLRSSTGFRGVIMSDDLGDAAAVASMPPGQRAVEFLSAGGDMITSQSLTPAETMASAVLRRASADPAFRATVNTAAKRVLAAKQSYSLLPC